MKPVKSIFLYDSNNFYLLKIIIILKFNVCIFLFNIKRYSDPESSDSEDDQELMRGKHDIVVDNSLPNSKKSSKKEMPPMFPYFEEKCKFDPYGEIIKYLLIKI